MDYNLEVDTWAINRSIVWVGTVGHSLGESKGACFGSGQKIFDSLRQFGRGPKLK